MIEAERNDCAADAFRDAETANLRAWMKLSGGEKVDFLEEMIELAYLSGALRPERLALRDVSIVVSDNDAVLGFRCSTRFSHWPRGRF